MDRELSRRELVRRAVTGAAGLMLGGACSGGPSPVRFSPPSQAPVRSPVKQPSPAPRPSPVDGIPDGPAGLRLTGGSDATGGTGRTRTVRAPTDGSDATTAILSQIASAPDGAVVLIPPGRYRCEGTLLVEDRADLTIMGASPAGPAVIYSRAPMGDPNFPRRHWLFTGCRNVVVRNLRVEGSDTSSEPGPDEQGYATYLPDNELEHGFALFGVDTFLLEDCSTRGTWGDGVTIGNRPHETASNCSVVNVTVEWNGRQGITSGSARNVVVKGCLVANSRRSAIDLEPTLPHWITDGFEVLGCRLSAHNLSVAALGEGPVDNVYIHRNTMERTMTPAIKCRNSDLARRRGWWVEDNRWLLPMPAAGVEGEQQLYFGYVDDIHVNRNVQHRRPGAAGRAALMFESCGGEIEVRDNDFTGNCRLYDVRGGGAAPVESGNVVSSDACG